MEKKDAHVKSKKTKGSGSLVKNWMKWGQSHMPTVQGVVGIIAGIVLLIYTRAVVINFVVFAAGLLLIYYGLVQLDLTNVSGIFHRLMGKARR